MEQEEGEIVLGKRERLDRRWEHGGLLHVANLI